MGIVQNTSEMINQERAYTEKADFNKVSSIKILDEINN